MAESSSLGNKSQRDLITALVEELKKSTQKDREATLSTLKKIFDNIVQHPSDDKYRQIKLTNKRFSSDVWRYPTAVNLMKVAGWEEDSDCVRLRDDSDAKAISKLLEQELQIMWDEPKPKRPGHGFHENVNTGDSDSSKCCALTLEAANDIAIAIRTGDGQCLKELLSPYHTACVKNMQVAKPLSITACVCLTRQIGIARILVNEYGVDFNSLDTEGEPDYLLLFRACDSTESCQLLIIEFIKEVKVDVHRLSVFTALHLAVLHKLFTVVKFLVEDYKVDVNCVSHIGSNGTPLHMAFGIGEGNIAQYLIEHGADQNALDSDGRKPIDFKLYTHSKNAYARISQFYIKRRVILKNVLFHEHVYFTTLCEKGYGEIEAVELTLAEFPSLKETPDGDIALKQNLEATPTLKELNHYITDMAPSYYNIGLELDIVNSKLKVIKCDPGLPNLEDKCHKVLEVWLENDTSATWKKLCDALQEVGMSVLAERIKNQL